MKYVLTLSLLAYSLSASPLAASGGNERQSIAQRPTQSTIGNFETLWCNPDRYEEIKLLLENLSSSAIRAAEDAKSSAGNTPSDAYITFFKDKNSAAYIGSLLSETIEGTARWQADFPFSKGNPTFVCVTPWTFRWPMTGRGAITTSPGRFCSRSRRNLFYVKETPYIILCPRFFQMEPKLPPQQTANSIAAPNCPVVDPRANMFRPQPGDDGWALIGSQMWELFDGLLRYYLVSRGGILKPEVYEINDVLGLGPREAYMNVANYRYYAAAVYGQCKDWPKPRETNRELLELESTDVQKNSTATESTKPATLDPAQGGPQ